MTQLITNVENQKKCRLDWALEEVAKGETKRFNSVQELMEDLEKSPSEHPAID